MRNGGVEHSLTHARTHSIIHKTNTKEQKKGRETKTEKIIVMNNPRHGTANRINKQVR